MQYYMNPIREIRPVNPYLRRWMVFVDGENFTLRGQAFALEEGLTLTEGPWFTRNAFLWSPAYPQTARGMLEPWLRGQSLREVAERAYYYTSVAGDDLKLQAVRERLWAIGFTPEVFKKSKAREKAKGVDIALTKDLLANAFLNNYDTAVLLTGDRDFVPVIQEVRRLGKQVGLMAFEGSGASVPMELRLACDFYRSLDDVFRRIWSDSWRDQIRRDDPENGIV